MRITGGRYRGRRIICPPGEIRPAMDRMRESLFAILGDLTGLSFLDLFSGSGVVAVEAASRGASTVWLVEKDRRKRPALERNTAFVEAEVVIRMMPVEAFLRRPQAEFDLVYLDPPFAWADKPALLALTAGSGVLASGGRLIIHAPRGEELPPSLGALTLDDQRRYGGSVLTFYE